MSTIVSHFMPASFLVKHISAKDILSTRLESLSIVNSIVLRHLMKIELISIYKHCMAYQIVYGR